MITRDSNQFYSKQQRFVFIHPDAEINPITDLPISTEDYIIVDLDDILTSGVPMSDDVEFEFYAILEPGEKV